MSFLLPAFLGLAAVLTLPVLIHRIRRPEREPIRFSSLMFVPKVKKEVIERRKIQHWLLMFLRMLLFLLLVFAFSRPFYTSSEQKLILNKAPEWHLILVDTSYSMSYGEGFGEAVSMAQDILAKIPEEARVGIVSFDSSPRMRAGLDGETAATTHQRSRDALDALTQTQNTTDYLAALQFAEQELLAQIHEDAPEEACVLHMVSDFRRGGLPRDLPSWRLNCRVRFVPYQVGDEVRSNLSVSDVAVRNNLDDDTLVVSARIKNWDRKEVSRPVHLLVGDEKPLTQTRSFAGGNAVLVSWKVPMPEDGVLQGRVALEPDAFGGDNVRYLFWREPPRKRAVILGDEASQKTYGPAWFFKVALDAKADQWDAEVMSPATYATWLETHPSPDALIIAEPGTGSGDLTGLVNEYAKQGGRLLLALGDRPGFSGSNREILLALGVTADKVRRAKGEAYLGTVGQISLDHPIFYAFQGARFNDFSSVGMHAYHSLGGNGLKPLARLDLGEGSGPVIMGALEKDKLKAVIWGFVPDLAWTNLVRQPRFVPVLLETVGWLCDLGQTETHYRVGDEYPLQRLESSSGRYMIQAPDGEVLNFADRSELTSLKLKSAGFLSFRSDENGAWKTLQAINGDSSEGNPEVISLREFTLKFTSNGSEALDAEEKVGPMTSDVESRIEFGHFFFFLLFPLLIAESIYAIFLSRRKEA